jgi:hypothetical protein
MHSTPERPRIVRLDATKWRSNGSPALLEHLQTAAAVALRNAVDPATCHQWVERILAARKDWIDDFGGEQFALGRAFYTHYETGRADLYFREAAQSNALVERVLPGMQESMRDLLAGMVGGQTRLRRGYCGPGVHVFPAQENVAKRGGVIHYDVEGLSPLHIERRSRAMSLVVMLQLPLWGGGLRLWNATWQGADEPDAEEIAGPHITHRYALGEALLMESHRLHQIRPFRGALDRISITIHSVEVDRGLWDSWF